MLFATVPASAYMYHSYQGIGNNQDWKKISGTFEVPLPTMDAFSHKDYLVYFTDPLTGWAAGSGLYYQKDSAGSAVITCFMRLYADDNPDTNERYVTCAPTPSGSVSASVTQSTNDGKTWTGTSGGNTKSITFSTSGSMNPRYFGATSGSSTNNLNLYMGFSNLKVTTWGGSVQNFNDIAETHKCYVDSGYKFDLTTNGNWNAFRTGPPAITVNECGVQDDAYNIQGGDWL